MHNYKQTEVNIINIMLKDINNTEDLSLQIYGLSCTIGSDTYEVIDTSGNVEAAGIIVLNNVPVKSEGRSAFEKRFLNRPRRIENEPGFKAIRIMRPMDSNTYVILSQWASEEAFRDWQNSVAYSYAHKHRGSEKGIDQDESVLKEKPYHQIYTASLNDA